MVSPVRILEIDNITVVLLYLSYKQISLPEFLLLCLWFQALIHFKNILALIYRNGKRLFYRVELQISLFFTEQDPPMFNIIDCLSMSSHEFLLAGDNPDPLKYLGFYKNVKAALREKLAFKDKNSPTISSLKPYSCIYSKIYNFYCEAN